MPIILRVEMLPYANRRPADRSERVIRLGKKHACLTPGSSWGSGMTSQEVQ